MGDTGSERGTKGYKGSWRHLRKENPIYRLPGVFTPLGAMVFYTGQPKRISDKPK